MKSKAPLVMMEQMVMILVFALAAALCLQAFVLSDSISQENQRRDQAALLCQNLAEECKALGYGQTDAHPILTAGESAAGGEEGSYVERETSGPASVFYYDENGQQMKDVKKTFEKDQFGGEGMIVKRGKKNFMKVTL